MSCRVGRICWPACCAANPCRPGRPPGRWIRSCRGTPRAPSWQASPSRCGPKGRRPTRLPVSCASWWRGRRRCPCPRRPRRPRLTPAAQAATGRTPSTCPRWPLWSSRAPAGRSSSTATGRRRRPADRPTCWRRSAWSWTCRPTMWRPACGKQASGSASRRSFTRPCGTRPPPAGRSGCRPCSTSSGP